MDMAQRLDAYLTRIGLDRRPQPDAAGLMQVQAAHRQAIPFENLDIPLGRGIDCSADSVFAKLVSGRRGGFCFEHNRLLADMLTALGFTNRLLLARVLLGNPPQLTPRTHCLVLVEVDGEPWIADAGFGGSYAPPMRLGDGEEDYWLTEEMGTELAPPRGAKFGRNMQISSQNLIDSWTTSDPLLSVSPPIL